MKEKKSLRIIFLQGDYPPQPQGNPYFGRGGKIHKSIEAALGVKICWHFVGGFITDARDDFWSKINNADAFFTSDMNWITKTSTGTGDTPQTA